MSTHKGYRPASPERIAERIAWAKAVALEHGRLAHSQLVALMQPVADKDLRIACRKLTATSTSPRPRCSPPASSALIAQARPLDQRALAPSAVALSPEGGRI